MVEPNTNEYLVFPAGSRTLRYYGKIELKHFKNLIIGLAILSINGVWLTDIKPGNILIFETEGEITLKFCDLSSFIIPDILGLYDCKGNNNEKEIIEKLQNSNQQSVTISGNYFPQEGWDDRDEKIKIQEYILQTTSVLVEGEQYTLNALMYYPLYSLIKVISDSILSQDNEDFFMDIKAIITRENIIRKYNLSHSPTTIFDLIEVWNKHFKDNEDIQITKKDYSISKKS